MSDHAIETICGTVIGVAMFVVLAYIATDGFHRRKK